MNQPVNERLNHHIQLLNQVQQRMQRANESNPGAIADEILHQLQQLIEQLEERTDSAYAAGQDWLMGILVHQPQLTPVIDRDLLWFFGGECLHFMSDEEIDLFQKLDEQEAEHDQTSGSFDRDAVKALLQQSSDQFDA
ncbi:PA2817 family protein [Bacterioplanoides sp.]|uniref:PA2817 family protein n=1 Tax=Bacterioplanoides sp. TaxID=2066072 RepID=UPI003B58FA77